MNLTASPLTKPVSGRTATISCTVPPVMPVNAPVEFAPVISKVAKIEESFLSVSLNLPLVLGFVSLSSNAALHLVIST